MERSRFVVACGILPAQRARLVDALRGRAAIRIADSFGDLDRLLLSQIDPVDCVVLPFHDPSGADATRTVRRLVKSWPRVAIVAYGTVGSQYSNDLRGLAAAGVHQFVFAGIDDDGVAFRAVLDAARQQCAAENVLASLSHIVPSTLHSMVEAALSKPEQITTVGTLASSLGVVRGTIFNRCVRAWPISPEEMLTWTRLALVAYFLETTGCTVETIANRLSYASPNALRNTIKRYCGLRATEVREAGGLKCVVRALRVRIASLEKRAALHVE